MASSEEEANALMCCICLFMVDNKPVTLQCGHSYCQKCLAGWIQERQEKGLPLTCPLDRLTISHDSADHVSLGLQAMVVRKRRKMAAMAQKAQELRSAEEAVERALQAAAAAVLERERRARDLQERERHRGVVAAKLVATKAASAQRQRERLAREAAAAEARAEAAAALLEGRRRRREREESKARELLERRKEEGETALVSAAAAAAHRQQQQQGGKRPPAAKKAAQATPTAPQHTTLWRWCSSIFRLLCLGVLGCFVLLYILPALYYQWFDAGVWGWSLVTKKVYVSTVTGGGTSSTPATVLYMEFFCTVGGVKARLQEKLGHPIAQQRLTYGGVGLDDDKRTLFRFRAIGRDSTLHLFLRPDGDTGTPIIEGELWTWVTTPPTFNPGSIMHVKNETLPPFPFKPTSPAAAVAALAAELLAPSSHVLPYGPPFHREGLALVGLVGILVDAMWDALMEEEEEGVQLRQRQRHFPSSSSSPIDWLKGESVDIQKLRSYVMGRDEGGDGAWNGDIVAPYADIAAKGLSRLWAEQHTHSTATTTATPAADVLAPVRYLVALVDASYTPGCLLTIRKYRRLLFLLLWGNPAFAAVGVPLLHTTPPLIGVEPPEVVRVKELAAAFITPPSPPPFSSPTWHELLGWPPTPTTSYPPPPPSTLEWEEVLGWSKPGVQLCGEVWFGAGLWGGSLRAATTLSLLPYWDTPRGGTVLAEEVGIPGLVERAEATLLLFHAAIKLWAAQGMRGGMVEVGGDPSPWDGEDVILSYEDAQVMAISFVFIHFHLMLGGNLQRQLGGRGLSALLKDLDAQILGTSHVPRLWPALVALVLQSPFDLHELLDKERWFIPKHMFLTPGLQKHLFGW